MCLLALMGSGQIAQPASIPVHLDPVSPNKQPVDPTAMSPVTQILQSYHTNHSRLEFFILGIWDQCSQSVYQKESTPLHEIFDHC